MVNREKGKLLLRLGFVFLLMFSLGACSSKSKNSKTHQSNFDKQIRKQENKALEIDELKGPDFTETKIIKKIHQRQGKRGIFVNEYKLKGFIGESESGFLKVRTLKSLSKNQKNRVVQIVKVENSDRKRLFVEIARLQKYNKDSLKKLRFQMFKTYLKFDPKGVWFYLEGNWQKK